MIFHGYTFGEIVTILGAKPLSQQDDRLFDSILTDSRKLLFPDSTLFFAISSTHKDASAFIPSLYEKGVRGFVTDKAFTSAEYASMPEASIAYVEDSLGALQKLASFHRHRFHYPVIGITGSNGKTIVKEWLFQLLNDHCHVVQSPKSYNSQVGVPLSLWQMNESFDLGIFEAGISQKGEMQSLQKMIDPQIGIITYIGEAHAKGFSSRDEKIFEKLSLFQSTSSLVFNSDDKELHKAAVSYREKQNPDLRFFLWGKENADVLLKKTTSKGSFTAIACEFEGKEFEFSIPFTDAASISNAMTCFTAICLLGKAPEIFLQEFRQLRPVEMRLELKEGINDCSLINDSYSADLSSLSVALDFLEQQQQHPKRSVILSDFLQSGLKHDVLYQRIADILKKKKIHRFVGIGPEIRKHAACFSGMDNIHFFDSTEDFIKTLPVIGFSDETILLKGARVFRFEKISNALQQKMHETVLEISLHALRHNLKEYRKLLKPSTRMMIMVKAFSYGSGSFEVANLLQHAGADYLAVAYADEGIELRKAGISLPVMVMNPEEASFHQLVQYRLEPEIYSTNLLHAFHVFLKGIDLKDFPVHIKVDTGMHRLGFTESETIDLCDSLVKMPELKVRSVFSHLAASDDPRHDDFTKKQAGLFLSISEKIEKAVGYPFMRHLSNSSAIHRHPDLQFDMVRLGIGLYGIENEAAIQSHLMNVTTLKTRVAQIKDVKAGETVGYGRASLLEKDTRVAVVRIGYADGYPRSLSNGSGKMMINGMPAPVIGNVCMDMTMLDVTGLEAQEGDEVIVFGESLPVRLLADWAHTIPYEIITGISQRVKRVYFEE